MFVEDLNFHRNHLAALESNDCQMKQKLPSDKGASTWVTPTLVIGQRERETAGGWVITVLFIKRLWCLNNERSCWRCLPMASFVSNVKCCCGTARRTFVSKSSLHCPFQTFTFRWKIVFVTYECLVASVALLECLFFRECVTWKR